MLEAGLKAEAGRLIRDFAPTGEELAADFAGVARADRARYLRQNEQALKANVGVTDVTDRRRGVPPERVHMPGGIYVADYEVDQGIIQAAVTLLDRLSPVLTGEYKRHHTVLIDGVPVSAPYPMAAGEITILNPLVYARRLEPSWNGARVSSAAREGVYRVAARKLNAQFRGTYKCKFTFVSRDTIDPGGSYQDTAARVPALFIDQV